MDAFFYEHRDETLYIGEMTHHPFPVHVHEVAEVLCVTAGSVRMNIGGVSYRIGPGDIALVFPLTPHGYEEIEEGSLGLVAIFPPDIIPEYNSTFHSLIPEHPVICAADTGPDLMPVIRRLHELDMRSNLALCVGYLHVLLACTLHSLTYQPVYDYADRGLGNRILRYVSDHAFEDITLENASHALGISASHLSHFFAEKLRVNFRQFINTIRISKARLLMRDTSYTLTMISDACGYANMRTFRRAFEKEIGCLPSEYLTVLQSRINSGETGSGFDEGIT